MDLLVLIQIDGRQCALRAVDVQSVMELEAITPVPHSPLHVLGLSTKRSQTLTVVDCRSALGLTSHPNPMGQRAAVIRQDEHSCALLVDEIDDVEKALSDVSPISEGFGAQWASMAVGQIETAQGAALLLDVEKLVEGPVEDAKAA